MDFCVEQFGKPGVVGGNFPHPGHFGSRANLPGAFFFRNDSHRAPWLGPQI